MSKPLTVRDLYKECKKQIDAGNGNKVIMLSDDDEGNGYHYLWYSFTNDVSEMFEYIPQEIDKDIAEEKDTIILG